MVLSVCGVQVLFNFNPLLKLDGYYLLSDALEIPNLRRAGWDPSWPLRWLLWGAARRPPSRGAGSSWPTGLAAWTYSVLFLCLMAAALVPWWGHLWGTAGAVAAVALGLVAGPADARRD